MFGVAVKDLGIFYILSDHNIPTETLEIIVEPETESQRTVNQWGRFLSTRRISYSYLSQRIPQYKICGTSTRHICSISVQLFTDVAFLQTMRIYRMFKKSLGGFKKR